VYLFFIGAPMFICYCCKKTLPTEMFTKSTSRKRGVDAYCKPCRKTKREADKERHNRVRRKTYAENPEARQKYLDYHKNNYHKIKNKRKEYTKEYLQDKDNRAFVMFNSAKRRAKELNLEFDIEPEDVHIPDICPLLEIPIVLDVGKGRLSNGPSLDRIDNSKGYVKGNVQVLSDLANRMKNSATINQLKVFATNILKVIK